MKEIWRDSPRFNVRISSKGRVIGVRGHFLKPMEYGKKGYTKYLRVDVSERETKNIYKGVPIHRLVAETFLTTWNPNLQVNHKDGNKQNNNISNIEMVTASENLIHSYQTNLRDIEKYRGESVWMTNLTNNTVSKIKNDLAKAPRSTTGRVKRGFLFILQEKYKLTRSQIKDLSRNRSWKHII